jgi:hypothetical protein
VSEEPSRRDFWAQPSPARELAWHAHCTAVYRLRARQPFFDAEADRGLVLPTPRGALAKLLGRFGFALVPLAQLQSLAEATDAFIKGAP